MANKPRYDVFLSYSKQDEPAVEQLARRLIDDAGLSFFLDRWHVVPGQLLQEALEEALYSSRACAVFLGPAGLGTWESIAAENNRNITRKPKGFLNILTSN